MDIGENYEIVFGTEVVVVVDVVVVTFFRHQYLSLGTV
jgi:hypothetical protein